MQHPKIQSATTARLRTATGIALLLALVPAAAPPASAAEAEIGKAAPDFTLKDTEGHEHRLHDYLENGHIVVLEWFNPDCPFIKKHHAAHKTMNDLRARYAENGVVWLAINSGAPGKQGHGLEHNRKARESYGMEYPVLLDEQGTVGRMYGAKTTPHMFVIDSKGVLRYAGAIDDNRDVSKLGETNYVDAALAALVAGEEIAVKTSRPYGCSVKYSE
jgi:peroxiredoxin